MSVVKWFSTSHFTALADTGPTPATVQPTSMGPELPLMAVSFPDGALASP